MTRHALIGLSVFATCTLAGFFFGLASDYNHQPGGNHGAAMGLLIGAGCGVLFGAIGAAASWDTSR